MKKKINQNIQKFEIINKMEDYKYSPAEINNIFYQHYKTPEAALKYISD